MPYSLIFTESYEKIEKRFLKRHPDLLDRYHKTLAILEQDPFHPSLRVHALEGRLAGLHAVSINLQYRITESLPAHSKLSSGALLEPTDSYPWASVLCRVVHFS